MLVNLHACHMSKEKKRSFKFKIEREREREREATVNIILYFIRSQINECTVLGVKTK
mgnify:CR=1 FL=1